MTIAKATRRDLFSDTMRLFFVPLPKKDWNYARGVICTLSSHARYTYSVLRALLARYQRKIYNTSDILTLYYISENIILQFNNILRVTRHTEKTYCFIYLYDVTKHWREFLAPGWQRVCSLVDFGGRNYTTDLLSPNARDQLDAFSAKGPHMSDSRLFK